MTFTGSVAVGRAIMAAMAGGTYPRPCITEMGGKNACVVTAHGDLDRAATGIVRSAFGLTGQKCSALSRVYVEEGVAGALLARVLQRTEAIRVGDPCQRENWMGPVINEGAVKTYEQAIEQARRDGGRILAGGKRMKGDAYDHGYFVEPTIIDGLPKDHPLFFEELFVPILVGLFGYGQQLANGTSLVVMIPIALLGLESDVRTRPAPAPDATEFPPEAPPLPPITEPERLGDAYAILSLDARRIAGRELGARRRADEAR